MILKFHLNKIQIGLKLKMKIAVIFIFIFSDSIIPWVVLLEYAGKDVNIVKPWTCGKNKCPTGMTGTFCEREIGMIIILK